jgi:hypothetical protein
MLNLQLDKSLATQRSVQINYACLQFCKISTCPSMKDHARCRVERLEEGVDGISRGHKVVPDVVVKWMKVEVGAVMRVNVGVDLLATAQIVEFVSFIF